MSNKKTLTLGLAALIIAYVAYNSLQNGCGPECEPTCEKCAVTEGVSPAASSDADKYEGLSLEDLEGRLASNPDDLKLGSHYRHIVMEQKAYERCIAFFEKLVADNPTSGAASMNLGYAIVDKIPVEGAITQVQLANKALEPFSKAIELDPTWLAYYTRGNSYLYWPPIFGRTQMAIDDLENAIAISDKDTKKPYHVRAWRCLGDAYWRAENREKAMEVWNKALSMFPEDEGVAKRLSLEADKMDDYLSSLLDPAIRVDTNLSILY